MNLSLTFTCRSCSTLLCYIHDDAAAAAAAAADDDDTNDKKVTESSDEWEQSTWD